MLAQQQRRKAYLYLILTTSIWGSLYIAARLALQTIPPITLLCLRFIIAFIILGAMSCGRRKKGGDSGTIATADYGALAFIGFVGYFLGIGAQLIGTKYAGASVASLVNSTNPIAISLFAVLFLKETLTVHNIIAVLASVSGAWIILLRAEAGEANIGVMFSIVSVMLWSLSSVLVRRMAGKYSALTITTVGIGIAGLCSIPAAMLELYAVDGIAGMLSWRNLVYVAYLGIICTALPQWLWNTSLSLVEASTCSLFYPVQPLVSVLLSIAILGERIDRQFILGAICIIGGILYAVLSERT